MGAALLPGVCMFTNPLKISFFLGWAVYAFAIYRPSLRRFRLQSVARELTRPIDIAHDMATLVAWQVIPLIYVFSPWLDFANYHLPGWAGWVGVGILACGILVLRSAYARLGANWSPKLDVREGQHLVTEGIYSHIRHPIYAGMWLWSVSQPLVIQNWIAGWAMVIVFLPLYFVRVPREEAMLLGRFEERYREYVRRTGRIMPRFIWGGR
jgi:protein-S-isoprenylcysteine O-methyltransferase Ste14